MEFGDVSELWKTTLGSFVPYGKMNPEYVLPVPPPSLPPPLPFVEEASDPTVDVSAVPVLPDDPPQALTNRHSASMHVYIAKYRVGPAGFDFIQVIIRTVIFFAYSDFVLPRLDSYLVNISILYGNA